MPDPLNDRFAKHCKFELLERSDGYAKVLAVPDESSLNGADIVHGGYIFSLADNAFALASNTDTRLALSANAFINYLMPCPLGETLTATANVAITAGQGALYNIVVEGKTGVQYAMFQARASYKML